MINPKECLCQQLFLLKDNFQSPINDLSIGGDISFNNNKMHIKTNCAIDKDRDTKILSSNSSLLFSHFPFKSFNYSLLKKENNLKITTILNPFSTFFIQGMLSLDDTEKITSIPINITAKYKSSNNNLNFGINLDNSDLKKNKKFENFTLFAIKKLNFLFDSLLYAGIKVDYSLSKKYLKSMMLSFNLKKGTFCSLINLNLLKEDERDNFYKKLYFKNSLGLNKNFMLGADVNYNGKEEKKIGIKIYNKSIIDPFTKFKGIWNDNDKSIKLELMHNFRGFIDFGINSKFIPISNGDKDKEKDTNKFTLPNFAHKFGINIHFCENLE